MPQFLHGHAEWVETKDLTLGNFDSHLRIKVMALWSYPVCLNRKPCICNVFCPCATWGAGSRAHINATTITHFGQNWRIYKLPPCIVGLYYASSSTMWWFLDNFFCLVCGLLEKKQQKTIIILPILSALRNNLSSIEHIPHRTLHLHLHPHLFA